MGVRMIHRHGQSGFPGGKEAEKFNRDYVPLGFSGSVEYGYHVG